MDDINSMMIAMSEPKRKVRSITLNLWEGHVSEDLSDVCDYLRPKYGNRSHALARLAMQSDEYAKAIKALKRKAKRCRT